MRKVLSETSGLVLACLLVVSLLLNVVLVAQLARPDPLQIKGGSFGQAEEWNGGATQELLAFSHSSSDYIRYIYPRSEVLEEGKVEQVDGTMFRFIPADGSGEWYITLHDADTITILRDGETWQLNRLMETPLWPSWVDSGTE